MRDVGGHDADEVDDGRTFPRCDGANERLMAMKGITSLKKLSKREEMQLFVASFNDNQSSKIALPTRRRRWLEEGRRHHARGEGKKDRRMILNAAEVRALLIFCFPLINTDHLWHFGITAHGKSGLSDSFG